MLLYDSYSCEESPDEWEDSEQEAEEEKLKNNKKSPSNVLTYSNNENLTREESRLKAQLANEEGEKQITRDLFSGCEMAAEKPTDKKTLTSFADGRLQKSATSGNSSAELKINNFNDASSLAQSLSKTILESKAKSTAWLEFITILFQSCLTKMSLQDLNSFARRVNEFVNEAETERNLQLEYGNKKLNKGSTKQLVRFQDEYDLFYGDVKDKYDETEESEYEEFMEETDEKTSNTENENLDHKKLDKLENKLSENKKIENENSVDKDLVIER